MGAAVHDGWGTGHLRSGHTTRLPSGRDSPGVPTASRVVAERPCAPCMALLTPAYICPAWEKRETRATARRVSRADEHSSSRSRPQGHVASEGGQARGVGLGIGGASVDSVETVHHRERTQTAIQEPQPDWVIRFKAQVLSTPPSGTAPTESRPLACRWSPSFEISGRKRAFPARQCGMMSTSVLGRARRVAGAKHTPRLRRQRDGASSTSRENVSMLS